MKNKLILVIILESIMIILMIIHAVAQNTRLGQLQKNTLVSKVAPTRVEKGLAAALAEVARTQREPAEGS